jgi:hypothetical protein
MPKQSCPQQRNAEASRHNTSGTLETPAGEAATGGAGSEIETVTFGGDTCMQLFTNEDVMRFNPFEPSFFSQQQEEWCFELQPATD